jgi:uncharacterized protein with NRDE domain
MCLAVLALDAHPHYAVVLAANRDEFHARAADPAAWWSDDAVPVLAGRDRVAGGTWLGVDRRGRFAFVTNVREPGRHDPGATTRGTLVPRVLRDARPVHDALAAAVRDSARMNGFNLLAGDAHGASWGSNRHDAVVPLKPGLHGVSNAALDTPWPKLVRTRAALAEWVERGDDDPAALFAALADHRPAADDALPHTGVTVEWERMLSAPFIVAPNYGTRCSTVLTIGRDGAVRFVERSFDAAGRMSGEVVERFSATTGPSPDARFPPPRTAGLRP